MKKILGLIIVIAFLFPVVAFADITIYAGWIPDPAAESQELWHDPDTTIADNEVVVWSGNATDTTASFSYIGGDLLNDVVWHRTIYAAPTPPMDSIPIAPSSTPGATGIFFLQR